MLKKHDEKIFIELKAARKLPVNLMCGVQEEQERGRVVSVPVRGGGVAGPRVPRRERVAGLDPLSLYERLEAPHGAAVWVQDDLGQRAYLQCGVATRGVVYKHAGALLKGRRGCFRDYDLFKNAEFNFRKRNC